MSPPGKELSLKALTPGASSRKSPSPQAAPPPQSATPAPALRGTGPPGGPTKRRTFGSPECVAARALTRAWTAGGAPWGPDVLRRPELRPVSGSPELRQGEKRGK